MNDHLTSLGPYLKILNDFLSLYVVCPCHLSYLIDHARVAGHDQALQLISTFKKLCHDGDISFCHKWIKSQQEKLVSTLSTEPSAYGVPVRFSDIKDARWFFSDTIQVVNYLMQKNHHKGLIVVTVEEIRASLAIRHNRNHLDPKTFSACLRDLKHEYEKCGWTVCVYFTNRGNISEFEFVNAK